MHLPLYKMGYKLGHLHLGTHCRVHTGWGFSQVFSHAEPHSSHICSPLHTEGAELGAGLGVWLGGLLEMGFSGGD